MVKKRLKKEEQSLNSRYPNVFDLSHIFEPSNSVNQPPKTIRRQRVNLGIGHHQVIHFFNGRETNCKDVIIVGVLFAVLEGYDICFNRICTS